MSQTHTHVDRHTLPACERHFGRPLKCCDVKWEKSRGQSIYRTGFYQQVQMQFIVRTGLTLMERYVISWQTSERRRNILLGHFISKLLVVTNAYKDRRPYKWHTCVILLIKMFFYGILRRLKILMIIDRQNNVPLYFLFFVDFCIIFKKVM